jgi:glycosyltransferase involved in cell wall biosynthesis
MRIALLTRRFPPECCGVGDYTARLAESWMLQGHEVTVFVATQEDGSSKFKVRNSKGPDEEARARGIRVVRIRLDAQGDVREAARAIAAAEPERVQIEYSNYGWSRWGFAIHVNALVRALRKKRLPVTIALHEFPLTFAQAPLQAGISLLQRLHFALLVQDANEVLTNTRERVRILRGWFPWRRKTIHYRPNSSHIPVAAVRAEEKAALLAEHATGAALVVTTFGMFHPAKHYEDVIDAAGQMRNELPVAVWMLGNRGEAAKAYLEMLHGRVRVNKLEEQVWWPGRMEPAEISACLQASDIFVLPQPDGHLTRSSAFMAAAAHGLPVIAVRNAENQADFEHGENVWLVEASRADRFAEAMLHLAGDAALRALLGSNLRALYERKFSWAAAAGPLQDAEHAMEAGILKPQMNTDKHR